MRLESLAHSYDDLIRTLQDIGYVLDQTLFAAAYDWRMPVAPWTVSATSFLYRARGSQVTSRTNTTAAVSIIWGTGSSRPSRPLIPVRSIRIPLDSVDVIAHSTGGLIAHAYIQSFAYGGSANGVEAPWTGATTRLPRINNLILIGVPNLGAPKAYNILNNNWIADPVYKFVFSKIIYFATQELANGQVISGPDHVIEPDAVLEPNNGLKDYQDFIRSTCRRSTT